MSNTEINVDQKINQVEKDEIYKKALSTWGLNAQIDMCIEEMAELMQAFSKYKRGIGDVNQIAEEMADVSIMLEQMAMAFDCHNKIVWYKQFKLTRLMNLLKSKK